MPAAVGTTDGIRLTWSVNDPAAARYEVWRRTESDAVYIKTGDTPATTSPERTDTGAPAGAPSCYRTVAVDAVGNRHSAARRTDVTRRLKRRRAGPGGKPS
ncbi:hypothetical protein ABT173_29635 [Streptomyces sp. NPDC001795]|uniref:hypothetical protein n=1 Tax=unclassified Streptomyces TaxID=2593676 RepID=UPI00331DC797